MSAVNVLMITPYAPARDGIADYAAALRQGLLAQGHDVQVLAARGGSTAPVEVVGSLDAPDRDWDQVTSSAPDVIHLQFAVAAYGSGLVRLLRSLRRLPHGAAKVVTMHEVTRDLALLGPVGSTVYRRVSDWADQIVVHTEQARQRLVELGVDPRKVVRVPHLRPALPPAECTGDDVRRRHRLDDARVVLAFGFIHVDKGLPVLVRALATGSDARLARARVVVAGGVRRRQGIFRLMELNDRRHARYVRRLTARLGVQDRVVFTDYVPAGEVAAWFEAADVVVLPYRRIEQSGVAALAAAARRPVIVSAVGGLAEDAATVAATFPVGDHVRLSELIPLHLGSDSPDLPPPVAQASLAHVVDATVRVYATGAATDRRWARAG